MLDKKYIEALKKAAEYARAGKSNETIMSSSEDHLKVYLDRNCVIHVMVWPHVTQAFFEAVREACDTSPLQLLNATRPHDGVLGIIKCSLR
jgi:hypothetical protein